MSPVERTPAAPRAARVCALAGSTVLLAVAAFQVAVALGAPWGAFTQGGANDGSLPTVGRLLAALSAVVLVVFAGTLLARVGRGPMARAPRRVVTVLTWVVVAYSGLGIVLNSASGSGRERAVFVPVTLVIFVTSIVAAWTTRRSPAAIATTA